MQRKEAGWGAGRRSPCSSSSEELVRTGEAHGTALDRWGSPWEEAAHAGGWQTGRGGALLEPLPAARTHSRGVRAGQVRAASSRGEKARPHRGRRRAQEAQQPEGPGQVAHRPAQPEGAEASGSAQQAPSGAGDWGRYPACGLWSPQMEAPQGACGTREASNHLGPLVFTPEAPETQWRGLGWRKEHRIRRPPSRGARLGHVPAL